MDYKKFSLESLSNWISDCITSSDATPKEIYDAIVETVREEYKIYKKCSDKSSELLNYFTKSNDEITFFPVDNDWESFYYPEEYSNSVIYTEEELNAMCDRAEQQEKEKPKKWTLPVEVDGASGEYYLQLPDDLLDKLNWKEGDTLEYINNSDGSFSVRKVTSPLGMDQC